MAKAIKKLRDPTQDVESSTSNAKSKKVKTCQQPKSRRAGKKNRGSRCKHSRKMQRNTKKSKKTMTRISKKKASGKTTPPTGKTTKANGDALFGYYHHLMEEMTSGTRRSQTIAAQRAPVCFPVSRKASRLSMPPKDLEIHSNVWQLSNAKLCRLRIYYTVL